ncbi:F-box family protein [Dorcoceras hygrometricum]|uniref:F-box family protein n=1 Tax=Dorcoceras hygrometricum TaxID=472368 RepID=A0A2Z7C2K9_9LAMI|nr:F-box family protein [Dorcoceras hygrometricum]
MSLFDLQDVCIAIGSLATLDLPMVVDLIGIYVLKGRKWVCLVTLVMSLFDLQDVCIAIGSLATLDLPMVVDLIGIYVLKGRTRRPTSLLPSAAAHRTLSSPIAAVPPPRDRTCFDHRDEEIPFVSNSSVLIVQADEGFVFPIVDLIRRSTAAYLFKCRFPCETGRSQAPRRQQGHGSCFVMQAEAVDPDTILLTGIPF